jgi:hypothetical protein
MRWTRSDTSSYAQLSRIVVGHAMTLTAMVIRVVVAPNSVTTDERPAVRCGSLRSWTLVAVAVLLAGVSVAASTIPAMRTARLASASFRCRYLTHPPRFGSIDRGRPGLLGGDADLVPHPRRRVGSHYATSEE